MDVEVIDLTRSDTDESDDADDDVEYLSHSPSLLVKLEESDFVDQGRLSDNHSEVTADSTSFDETRDDETEK